MHTKFYKESLKERYYSGDLGVLYGEHNIKIDLKEIQYKGADRIKLDQDRVQWQILMNTAMNPP
jgi:hypothetical protein